MTNSSMSSANNPLSLARASSLRLSAVLFSLQTAMLGPIVLILSSRTAGDANFFASFLAGSLIFVAGGLSLAALYPLIAQRISTDYIEKSILVFAPVESSARKTAESREKNSLVRNLRLLIRANVDLIVAACQFIVVSIIAPLLVGFWYLTIQGVFIVSVFLATARRMKRGYSLFLNRAQAQNTSIWIRFRSALSGAEVLLVTSPVVLAAGLALVSGAIDSLERLLLLFGLLSVSLSSASSFAASFPVYRLLKNVLGNPSEENEG